MSIDIFRSRVRRLSRVTRVAAACALLTALVTGCPWPPGTLKAGDRRTVELEQGGQVIFRQDIRAHELPGVSKASGLVFFLEEAPTINSYGFDLGHEILNIDQLAAFIGDTWPGGDPALFRQATETYGMSPEWLVTVIDNAGMTPADTVALMEDVDTFYEGSAGGSEVLALYEWLASAGMTFGDFVAAIQDTGYTTDAYLRHLNDIGVDVADLYDLYGRYAEVAEDAVTPFSDFIDLLGFQAGVDAVEQDLAQRAAAKASDVVEVGTAVFDLIRGTHVSTPPSHFPGYLNAEDTNWTHYDRGTLTQSRYRWRVYEWTSPWSKSNVVDVTFRIVVYRNVNHVSLPGQYVSSIGIYVDKLFAGAVSSVESSVTIDRSPTQIGTPQNPVPQGVVTITMASWWLGIPEAHNNVNFTVYGNAPWEWGVKPH